MNLTKAHILGRIAFTATTNGAGDILNPEESKKLDNQDALIYDSLYVRHWDTWKTEKVNAIFTTEIDISAKSELLEGIEPANVLNTGLESPVPVFSNASDFDITFGHVAAVAKDPDVNEAWNTASQIWLADLKSPSRLQQINATKGASSSPIFSPDGKTLAYLEMTVPGYEADKNKLVLYDIVSERKTPLISCWDRSPSSIKWNASATVLYLTADHHGRKALYEVVVSKAVADSKYEPLLISEAPHSTTSVSALSNGDLFLSSSSLARPMIYTILKESLRERVEVFKGSIPGLRDQSTSEFWFESDGRKVHALMTVPDHFDSSKKYPMIFLIHGGPQGAWLDAWSTRWNPSTMSNYGSGYVTVAINPTGSTGYGQEFTDRIQGHWGSRPYDDLVRGFDYALKTFSYIDPDRCAAAGASYGGYMINWIQGHDFGRRFKALICHDGVFNTFNVYYTTEELYFPERDFLGVPWDPKARECYEKWNPANFVENWATPQLIIHGSKDYRLTEGEGLAAFNVLQRRGIKSRLLIFKSENHWVLNPENSKLWHETVLGWIEEHTKKHASCFRNTSLQMPISDTCH